MSILYLHLRRRKSLETFVYTIDCQSPSKFKGRARQLGICWKMIWRIIRPTSIRDWSLFIVWTQVIHPLHLPMKWARHILRKRIENNLVRWAEGVEGFCHLIMCSRRQIVQQTFGSRARFSFFFFCLAKSNVLCSQRCWWYVSVSFSQFSAFISNCDDGLCRPWNNDAVLHWITGLNNRSDSSTLWIRCLDWKI